MRINSYNLINNSGYPSLIKECGVNYPELCNTPEKIAEMMRTIFFIDKLMEEEFWVICMNNNHKILGIMSVSKGGYDFSIVDMKSLFTRVLLLGASKIAICHNHPSGCIFPSKEDMQLTQKIREASCLLDVELLDHLIVTNNNYYSFHENNCII